MAVDRARPPGGWSSAPAAPCSQWTLLRRCSRARHRRVRILDEGELFALVITISTREDVYEVRRRRLQKYPRETLNVKPVNVYRSSLRRRKFRFSRKLESQSRCCSQANQVFSRSGACTFGLFHTTVYNAVCWQPFAEHIG